MTDASNRREFTRVPVKFTVTVRCEDTHVESDITRDVSMSGLFIQCEIPLPVGSRCEFEIVLSDGDSASRIEGKARVARSMEGGMALDFTDLVGVESLSHLRNLVLYNSHNASEVEQEILHHRGIRRAEV